jgi:hypothetical protein
MKARQRDTGSYLDGWRRADPVACGDDLESEATAGARLEADYDDARLHRMIANGGLD